ncbi:transport energizing protein, ExbD/TolR family [Verrucomicrobiia bacterium DG1235]|nr:transport energizing protein, ExbD/TolR family [Verrucomicrobiae bacterium DG1235]
MKSRRSILEGEAESDEINISPLIDMVFILLIFFIVTTVFVEETGVEVNKPQAASAADLEKNSILIAITDKGKVVYGGKEVGLSGVRSIVRQLVSKDQMPVIIQADKTASIDLYTRVHDECKLAGANMVNLATEG